MSAQQHDVSAVIDAIPGRTLPSWVNGLSLAGLAWGAVAFGYGLFASAGGAAWTWGAYLVALVYVLAIAQGGVIFAVILTGTWGRWGRPLKRVGEALAFFLPVAYLLLIVFLLFGNKIYVWNPDTIIEGGAMALAPHSPEAWASKEFWLSQNFFIGRLLFAIGLLVTLDLLYLRASLKPDLIQATAALGDKAPAWWSRITGGDTDLDAARDAGIKFQATIFPVIGFLYALVFSLVAFDMIMSLAPWWFSNMFGGWIFASSVWLSLATMGFVAVLARDWLGLGDWLTTNVTHDLGKLLLAFCMFWAYTTYAQLLPIWYTDMPEETDFLLVRMYLPQWSWLAKTVAICCFVGPFTILLSRGIKKMRYPFAGICTLIMFGIFMERSLLVMPSVYFGDTFPAVDFLIVNVGMLAGFLGLMVQVVGRVMAQLPMLVISDPYLGEHPWDQHVHSLDHAH